MKWAAMIAGLFAGTAGAMGLGGGAVLIIHLALFTDTPQLESQGINLLFFIPIALAAVTVYAIKKNIRWRLVLKTAVWGLVGSAAGLMLTDSIGGDITGKIFGVLLIIMGGLEIFGKKEKPLDKKAEK